MELLLLVFFCLLTGSEVTFGAGTTVTVDEGSDVTLPCLLREDITNKKFVWKKDGRQVFLYDDGDHSNNAGTGQEQQFVQRVSHFPDKLKSGDASITISNSMVADNGNYTCEFPDLQPRQIFHVKLIVYDGDIEDRGTEETKVITVTEGRDATLPCSLREDITNKKFEWKIDGRQVFLYDDGDHSNNVNTGQDQLFKGRVSYFLHELKSGDASIIISNTKVTDRGLYTCIFSNQPEKIFHIVLFVERDIKDLDQIKDQIKDELIKDLERDILGGKTPAEIRAEAKPSLRILEQTDFNAELQCEVQGVFPKPELHWEDGARNKLPADEPQVIEKGGHYDIILQLTVTKTDYYRCVATYGEINRTSHAGTYVHIHVAVPQPSVTKLEQRGKSAVLQCEARGGFPKPEFHWEDGAGNKLPAEEPQESEKEGRYAIILQTIVTKTDIYRCVATQKENNQQAHADIPVDVTVKAPKPSVRTKQGWFSTTVQCEIKRVFPKPELFWQDRAGNKLEAEKPQESEREGLYDIILQLTVTKTGNYRCVATQEEINHQTDAETYVSVPEQTDGEIVLIFIGAVAAAVVVLAVYRWRYRFMSCCRKEPTVITVDEGRDVTLPCLLNTVDITNKKFVWKKDGRQMFLCDKGQDQPFRERISRSDKQNSGDASITISNTKAADSGDYICEFPDLQPRQIFYVRLIVVVGPTAPTAPTAPDDETARLTNETDVASPLNGNSTNEDSRV